MGNKKFIGGAIALIFSLVSVIQAQWTPDPFCPFPSDHVTRYPYYGNCSVYWECYKGTKYVMECPEGLEFNAPLQECDTPEIAMCDPLASTTANPNPPTWTTVSTTSHQPGPDCPYPSEDLIYFPYEGDCTKYWECFEGNSYIYNCPPGLWWHQAISECDYPGDFCNNSTAPTTEPSTTNEISSTNTPTTPHGHPNCDGSGGDPIYYPYYGDCTKYWECANGKLYEYDCPSGLWWHQETSECDYPGDFCDNSTTFRPTTTTPLPSTTEITSTIRPTTTEAPEPNCDGTGSDNVFFPYPGDCTKYWECANGKLYLYDCPDGLWWNEQKSQCDYPGSYCRYSTISTVRPTTPSVQCADEGTSYWPDPNNCHYFIECRDGARFEVECPGGLYYSEKLRECVNEDTSECCLEHECKS